MNYRSARDVLNLIARICNHYVLFLVAWCVLLTLVIVALRIGRVSGYEAIKALALLISPVLGTTGIFLVAEKKDTHSSRGLITLSLLLSTPEYFLNGMPVLLVPMALILGHLSFDAQWLTPVRIVGGIVVVLGGAVSSAFLQTRMICRFIQGGNNRFVWLLAFPIYLNGLVAHVLLVLVVLLVAYALGLYPNPLVWF